VSPAQQPNNEQEVVEMIEDELKDSIGEVDNSIEV
jgi:hypothetical protein